MNALQRFLLGLSEQEVPPGAELDFAFHHAYQGMTGWIAVLVLVAALLLICLLYQREKALSMVQRTVLSFLRIAALLVVALILLDPRLHTELLVDRAGSTLILVDGSDSMGQRDAYPVREARALENASGLNLTSRSELPSRLELALSALETNGLEAALANRNRLHRYAFGADLSSVEGLDALYESVDSPSEVCDGSETRLGDALRDALLQVGHGRVAGCVVVSDGRNNAGGTVRRAASEFALRGVPVHVVGVGRSDTKQNYSITQASGPDVGELGFPLQLEARVRVAGIRGPFQLALKRKELPAGPTRTIEVKRLNNSGHTLSTRVTFVDLPKSEGSFRYTFSIAPHDDESETADNSREVEVRVTEEQRRVLVVSGSPSFEYRFLRNFLLRDPGVQASFWLSTADRGYPQDGDVVIRGVPQDAASLRPYDSVVLMDPEPSSLTPRFLRALTVFVSEYGGGLAYVAGEFHLEELIAGKRFAPLWTLLPVIPELPTQGTKYHTRPWWPRLTPQGVEHPLCRLDDENAKSRRLWSSIPEFYYVAPASQLKPAASALLTGKDDRVVLAEHRVGVGYAVYLGSDEFHNWRRVEFGRGYERFWSGLVRFLALGKALVGEALTRLEADRDRYQMGDDVVLEASLLNSKREPVERRNLEVRVTGGGRGARLARAVARSAVVGIEPASGRDPSGAAETTVLLQPVDGQPGSYQGRLPAEEPGVYLARLVSTGKAREGETATFRILPATAEWDDVTPDFEALEELANATGGTFRGLQNLHGLAEEIPDRSVRETIGRADTPVWDSGLLLLVLAALIIAEWALRKWWRLN